MSASDRLADDPQSHQEKAMLLLFAAVAISPDPAWWGDFQRAYSRCGVVFNVDGLGLAGDGILIEKDSNRLTLSNDHRRPQKPIDCVARWAKTAGLEVRYHRF